jgi:transposase InsO family protein
LELRLRDRPDREWNLFAHSYLARRTDEHTRQCLAIHPGWSIQAVDVITVVEAAIARYGAPKHLRSDNGPEFIASCMQDWLKAQEIKTLYIKLGSPWETGILRAFMTSCAMNVARTARLATDPERVCAEKNEPM